MPKYILKPQTGADTLSKQANRNYSLKRNKTSCSWKQKKDFIYLFHFFIIRLFRVCCWNSSDNCLRLHKSNCGISVWSWLYKKLPKNFYSHNIRLKTSKCRDLPLSIAFLTMSWISHLNKTGRYLKAETYMDIHGPQ